MKFLKYIASWSKNHRVWEYRCIILLIFVLNKFYDVLDQSSQQFLEQILNFKINELDLPTSHDSLLLLRLFRFFIHIKNCYTLWPINQDLSTNTIKCCKFNCTRSKLF